MKPKERLEKFLKKTEEFHSAIINDSEKTEILDCMKYLQTNSMIVRSIFEQLDMSLLVGSQITGTYDILAQSFTTPEKSMHGYGYSLDTVQATSLDYLKQKLREAIGFLGYSDVIEDELLLGSLINSEIQNLFLLGEYGSACGALFKKFKHKVYESTGTENIDSAIGELKKKLKLVEKDGVKNDFLSGTNSLLKALNHFRNVEFHSNDWSVNDKTQALYFISLINMANSLIDQYFLKKETSQAKF